MRLPYEFVRSTSQDDSSFKDPLNIPRPTSDITLHTETWSVIAWLSGRGRAIPRAWPTHRHSSGITGSPGTKTLIDSSGESSQSTPRGRGCWLLTSCHTSCQLSQLSQSTLSRGRGCWPACWRSLRTVWGSGCQWPGWRRSRGPRARDTRTEVSRSSAGGRRSYKPIKTQLTIKYRVTNLSRHSSLINTELQTYQDTAH